MNVREMLVRKPVEVAAGLGELESRTLERAREALGYAPERSVNDIARSTATAKDIFTRLGIDQFTPKSVREYKEEMLVSKNAKAKVANFFANGGGIAIMIISCAATAVITFISLLSYFEPTMGSAAHPFFYAGWQWPLVFAAPTAILSIICANLDDTEYEWEKTPLNAYTAEVPYFALSRAIEISEQHPEASFYVESLQAREVVADPFLVVAIQGYLYYVDVWDEPKFEGRRVK